MHSTHRLTLLLAATLTAACTAAKPPAPAAPTTAAITEQDLRQRLFLIADDSMMGRESGSAGNYKTADYVAAEFKRLGLEPAGENGSYFQTVPLWTAAVDTRSRIEAAGTALQLGADFLPNALGAPARSLDGVQAIYGGPITDSTRWISSAEAAGKLVVLDLPPGTPRRGLNIGARWRSSAAVALVVLDAIGAETITTLREGRPVADTARSANAIPALWISRRAAAVLLGGDPVALKPGAAGATLRGWFDIARTPVKYPARNVIAILRGSDPALRGQYVSLSAHNDHVGYDHFPVDHDSIRAFDRVVRPMGADSPVRPPTAAEWTRIHGLLDSLRKVHKPRLDSIRNGADDDGSGTVALLEIAEAMARGGAHPRRSILFVNHMGEEAGLLGSKWFTDHPTVPVDSIVAEIDEDMTGRGLPDDFPLDGTVAATPTYLEVIGAKRLSREFGDSLEAANAREPVPFKFDYRFDAPGHPLQYYCRADHYNYARYGIPAVALSRGEHLDYHQVTDEAQYIDYPDLARVTRMVHSAALVIANMGHRPKLDVAKPGDPHVACRQ
ncbi:MAG: M28 family peptidase [Gemmatimonadetes bacterium]|nr:M28 family peptidase [Gemmatimonadota bacterium]